MGHRRVGIDSDPQEGGKPWSEDDRALSMNPARGERFWQYGKPTLDPGGLSYTSGRVRSFLERPMCIGPAGHPVPGFQICVVYPSQTCRKGAVNLPEVRRKGNRGSLRGGIGGAARVSRLGRPAKEPFSSLGHCGPLHRDNESSLVFQNPQFSVFSQGSKTFAVPTQGDFLQATESRRTGGLWAEVLRLPFPHA